MSRKNKVTKEKLETTELTRVLNYAGLTKNKSCHGKCTDWIRENRRRRSSGLLQKRILKINGHVFDPMTRKVTMTHADGTQEVYQV